MFFYGSVSVRLWLLSMQSWVVVTETDPQSQQYLLLGPSQEKSADPWYRIQIKGGCHSSPLWVCGFPSYLTYFTNEFLFISRKGLILFLGSMVKQVKDWFFIPHPLLGVSSLQETEENWSFMHRPLYLCYHFFFFKDFMYLFDRHRSQVDKEAGRERGGSRLPAEQRAQWGAPSQDLGIMIWAEGRGFNPLSHPGAPVDDFLIKNITYPLSFGPI